MARLIRPLRQWPQLQDHHHCCSQTTLGHFLYSSLPLTISTKAPSYCFSFATSTSSRGNSRHRPCGAILPNDPSDLQEGETNDSESDVKKSRNQKKREARRAISWGMDLASFSTPQIKRILRVASLEQDVFDALMSVKSVIEDKVFAFWLRRLGPDVREGKRRQFNYIGEKATKVGDQKTLQALAGSKAQIPEEEDDDQFEYSRSQEFVNVANRWFGGLISKDIEITNEVYSVNSVDFDRQVLRKLVRRVQTIQEQSQIVTEEDKAKVKAAVTRAKKSLTCFLRTIAKQLLSD